MYKMTGVYTYSPILQQKWETWSFSGRVTLTLSVMDTKVKVALCLATECSVACIVEGSLELKHRFSA